MKVFCFGNPDLQEDSIALEIADELNKSKGLEGFEFVKCAGPDFLLNLSDEELEEIIIVDAVKGLKKVEVIEDINKIKQTKTTTMHDFDLGTVLKLMKETGKMERVRIIGLPTDMAPGTGRKKLAARVIQLLNSL